MSLATLIAQGGPRVSAPDIAGGLMEGAQSGRQAGIQQLQAQGYGLSNLADQVKLQQAQQAQADAQLQREQMNANTTVGPDGPVLNQSGYLSGLAQKGAAPIAYSEQVRLKAADLAAQNVKIENAQNAIKRRTQLLSGVQNPMQLAAVIPELEKQGVDVSEIRSIPFRTDWKQVLDGMIQQGLTHSERMDQMKLDLAKQAATLDWQKADAEHGYKQQQFGLTEAQQAEAARHNKAVEGIDWYKAMHPASTMVPGIQPGGQPSPLALAVIQGRVDPKTLSMKQRTQITQEALTVDPTFDLNRASQAATARQDFAKGKEHDQVQGLNMLAEHLQALKDASVGMGGLVSSAVKSIGGSAVSGDVSRFKQAREAVVGELSKLYKGGMPADKEIERVLDNISQVATPTARAAAIDEGIKLVGGRLIAKRQQLNSLSGMDPNITILSPRTKEIFAKNGHGDLAEMDRWDPSGVTPLSQFTPGFNQGSATASAPTITSKAQYDALPAGAAYTDANGAPHVKGGAK